MWELKNKILTKSKLIFQHCTLFISLETVYKQEFKVKSVWFKFLTGSEQLFIHCFQLISKDNHVLTGI